MLRNCFFGDRVEQKNGTCGSTFLRTGLTGALKIREPEKSLVLPDASLLHSNPVKRLAALVWLGLLAGNAPLQAAEPEAESTLRNTTSFALGGVGVAGTMSQGERALREILKQPDAISRLESLLPQASPAGQLYALLGLRAQDRDAYQRASIKYGQRDGNVETMRGCILQREPFRTLAKQIDHGDYDSSLSREWPKR